MNRLRSLALAALFLGLARPALAGDAPPAPAAPAPVAPAQPKEEFLYVELKGVEGVEIAAVAKALAAVDGVRSFAWSTEGTEAKVVREVGKAPEETLWTAAKGAGAASAARIPVTATTFAFDEALHCGGCVRMVNKALHAIPGVKESTVADDLTRVDVVYDTRSVKPSDVEAALAKIERPAKATKA